MIAQQKKTYGFFLTPLHLELHLNMIRVMVFFGMERHGKTPAPYVERSARKARKAHRERWGQQAVLARKAQQDQTEPLESTEQMEQMVPPVLMQ